MHEGLNEDETCDDAICNDEPDQESKNGKTIIIVSMNNVHKKQLFSLKHRKNDPGLLDQVFARLSVVEKMLIEFPINGPVKDIILIIH